MEIVIGLLGGAGLLALLAFFGGRYVQGREIEAVRRARDEALAEKLDQLERLNAAKRRAREARERAEVEADEEARRALKQADEDLARAEAELWSGL